MSLSRIRKVADTQFKKLPQAHPITDLPNHLFLQTVGCREVYVGWKAPAPAASMLRVRTTWQP